MGTHKILIALEFKNSSLSCQSHEDYMACVGDTEVLNWSISTYPMPDIRLKQADTQVFGGKGK